MGRGTQRSDHLVTTEGQRLLLLVDVPLAEIADAIGVSGKAIVAHWRTGYRLPGRAPRAALSREYAIPADSWDAPPAVTPAQAAKPPARPAAAARVAPAAPVAVAQAAPRVSAAPSVSTLDDVIGLLELATAAIAQPGISAAALDRAMATKSRMLALKARLESDAETLERRVVDRHPRWHQIRAVVLGALAPHPDALASVRDALCAVDAIDPS